MLCFCIQVNTLLSLNAQVTIQGNIFQHVLCIVKANTKNSCYINGQSEYNGDTGCHSHYSSSIHIHFVSLNNEQIIPVLCPQECELYVTLEAKPYIQNHPRAIKLK